MYQAYVNQDGISSSQASSPHKPENPEPPTSLPRLQLDNPYLNNVNVE